MPVCFFEVKALYSWCIRILSGFDMQRRSLTDVDGAPSSAYNIFRLIDGDGISEFLSSMFWAG